MVGAFGAAVFLGAAALLDFAGMGLAAALIAFRAARTHSVSVAPSTNAARHFDVKSTLVF